MAGKYEPMLLTPGKELPAGENWAYELKLDGYRAVTEVGPDLVVMRSRQGKNFTERFSGVASGLPMAFPGHRVVVDGEVIAFTDDGVPDWNELRKKHARAAYYIFDLLEIDDKPIVARPLSERREIMGGLFVKQPTIFLSSMFKGEDRLPLVRVAYEQGHEGIVAKDLNSPYTPGRRSNRWLKFKFNTPKLGRFR